MDIEEIFRRVERVSDQAAVNLSKTRVTQIRFSNNVIDISNEWNEELASVFLAKNGRTFMFDLKNEKDLDKILPRSISAIEKIGENTDFVSLNDRKNNYRKKRMNDES
jgi:Putative modulator of DNA gyrase.